MFKKTKYCVQYSFLLVITMLFGCSLFPLDFNTTTTPTKEKMKGVWVLTDAYNQEGSQIVEDINFPITAFYLSNDNTVESTAGPMFMHIVYGGGNYTKIASKVDQVFKYITLELTGGEWFISDSEDVSRFTIEMKLKGLPGQTAFTEVLSLLGIKPAFLDVTIYHMFNDIKVTFDDAADSVMVWEFDSQTTATYNTKDQYGKSVLWNGWPVNNFERGRFIFHKRSKTIKDLITEAKKP